ncbi:MAG: hypothetical protein NTZ65_00345 [Candidatus Berkelbacteria bacterium]|nr:hypothetical protein [Candidatus Berkelbacteria bacterium]
MNSVGSKRKATIIRQAAAVRSIVGGLSPEEAVEFFAGGVVQATAAIRLNAFIKARELLKKGCHLEATQILQCAGFHSFAFCAANIGLATHAHDKSNEIKDRLLELRSEAQSSI